MNDEPDINQSLLDDILKSDPATPQTAASPAEIAEILGSLKSKFLPTPKTSDHGHYH